MAWVSLDGRLPYEVAVYKDDVLVPPEDYVAEGVVVSIADDGQVTLTAPTPETGSWDVRVLLSAPSYALVRITEVAIDGTTTTATKRLGDEVEQAVEDPDAAVEFDAGQWDAVGVAGQFGGGE